MSKSTVYIKGLDVLEKGLKDMVTLDDVKKAVLVNTTEMTEQAKRNAPVRTGDLRGSITPAITDGGLTGKAAPHVDYGPYVELGTRFMNAQPYLKPAHNVQSQKFIQDLKKLTK